MHEKDCITQTICLCTRKKKTSKQLNKLIINLLLVTGQLFLYKYFYVSQIVIGKTGNMPKIKLELHS